MLTRRLIAATFAASLLLPALLFAFTPRAVLARAGADPVPGHATIIVLDMSGSMSTNDPQGLRCSAANAYIDLSGSNPREATNYVGLVGLDNDNATGGSEPIHQFRSAAVWAQPTATNSQSNRLQLRDSIARLSNNCAPHGNTPTFDALNQAFSLLDTFVSGKNIKGSVILLTDGNPDPQGDAQVAATENEVVPQFAKKHYPIDTIALGTDRSYRDFLTTIAQKTGGTAYDDTQGPIQGVSPLNLERVFVDIFLQYEGRKLRPSIAPMAVTGGSVTQEFSIGNDVSHLDVIAVKEQPGTTMTLTDPNGQLFKPESEGNFISSDPHYVIFALEAQNGATALQSGPWKLSVTGAGMFLVDSLVLSPLSISITAPVTTKPLPLGQPVTIKAAIVNQGTIVVDKTYSLKAIVKPDAGGEGQEVILQSAGSGVYSGTFLRPLGKDAPGNYTITVSAVANTRPVADDAAIHVTFALFPSAALLDPVTKQPQIATPPTNCQPTETNPCQPVAKPVALSVNQWHPLLHYVYTTLPGFSHTLGSWRPRDWPLNPFSLDPTTQVEGVVLVGTGTDAKPYGGAQVTVAMTPLKADGTPNGPTTTVPVKARADGHFVISLPANAKGAYSLALTTSGNGSDVYGDPVTVMSGTVVAIKDVPRDVQTRAFLITGLYLALLLLGVFLFIFGPLNYLVRPKPNGRSRLVDTAIPPGSAMNAVYPLRWRSAAFPRYFAPNRLPAGQASLPNNGLFDFGYGRVTNLRIRRPRGKGAVALWRINGRVVTPADGPEVLLPGMIVGVEEAGKNHEYRFEQVSRKGAALAPTKRQQSRALARGAPQATAKTKPPQPAARPAPTTAKKP